MIGNRRQHEGRQFRARHHHHRDRADEQEEIAQRDRGRGAERRLELRRVGGEARGDLAGLLRVEEAGIEPGQMGEEIGAQVGDHPLAERHHQVVARAGGQREHRDDADHGEKISADEAGVGVREAEVDHPPDRDRHDERRAGSDDRARSAPARSARDGRGRKARAASRRRARRGTFCCRRRRRMTLRGRLLRRTGGFTDRFSAEIKAPGSELAPTAVWDLLASMGRAAL